MPRQKPTPRLHPRNRHQGRYDLPSLALKSPDLGPFLQTAENGQTTLDFANPMAVKVLNRALLEHYHQIVRWDIPDSYLCPPLPGRSDLIHHLADLLASSHDGVIPKGKRLRGLDIGTGASLIYPLVGNHEYGWHFVGTDIDPMALDNAARILANNPTRQNAIELRRQPDSNQIFTGMITPGEQFDFTLCNPPFYASADQANQANRRKWQKMGKPDAAREGLRNFAGTANELYCTGGETGFLLRMADQSRSFSSQVFWFTSLVASADNLKSLPEHLRALGATDVRVIDMAQGNKRSRLLAWTFLDKKQRRAWRRARWPETRI